MRALLLGLAVWGCARANLDAAAARQSLLKADADFSADVAARGVEACFATVSEDGTLGYTWGNYLAATVHGEKRGKYLTVWRRDGGAWKAVADIGNPGDAEPGSGP